jgi:uncharacterized peroxidase-related enzyme
MPRLNIVDPATDTGPGADLLNGPLKAKQINIFKGLATNAGVLEGFLGFKKGIMTGTLSPQEHEVVTLVASQRNNCEYCLAAHTKVAAGMGIDEEQVLKIRQNQGADAKQQALIDFINAVMETNGFVSDEQLDAFRQAGYGDDAVIEVIAEIAVSVFTNLFNHVHETEIDFPVAQPV